MRKIALLLVLTGLGIGGGAYLRTYISAEPLVTFRRVAVKRGDLPATITATGTVEPEEIVDVGAQVTGMIAKLGNDPNNPTKDIDYGSHVHVGTVLAHIDDTLYQASVDQAKANLANAEANLLQLQAHCDQTKQEWQRAEKLRPTQAIADTDYDLDVANYKQAVANVSVGVANIEQAKAALKTAKANLAYCTIKSPVEGVIVDRRVNVGQTVVSSLSASSLALLAKDLRRIQVWASVNEADIGRIKTGTPVTFTVDAFPNETFQGKVEQVRLNAQMTQNVVTYTAVVATDNADLKLLPYLTANLKFQVDFRHNVLLVPNAALRWKPRPGQVAPDVQQKVAGSWSAAKGDGKGRPAGEPSGGQKLPAAVHRPGDYVTPSPNQPPRAAQRPHSSTAEKPERAARNHEHGRVWVQDGEFVRPVAVRVGVTDGVTTEISGDKIDEGTEVVIGEVHKEANADDTTNLFTPTMSRGAAKANK
jgi:HlyD family secretion protein